MGSTISREQLIKAMQETDSLTGSFIEAILKLHVHCRMYKNDTGTVFSFVLMDEHSKKIKVEINNQEYSADIYAGEDTSGIVFISQDPTFEEFKEDLLKELPERILAA